MDKFIKTGTGGLPLRLDDLIWEQGDLDAANYGIYQAIHAQLLAYGTDYIVEGCTYSSPNITAGWIMLAGELLRVNAHAGTNNYFAKVSTFDSRGDKVFNDSSSQSTYQVNRGVLNASSGSLNITTAKRLEDKVIELLASSSEQFSTGNIPDLDTSKVTSGVFALARIPDLSADKITSGVLGVARIPNLSADKITSGVLSVDRIPDLSADKITSGVLADGRIPSLNASKTNAGVFDIARIPSIDSSRVPFGPTVGDVVEIGVDLGNNQIVETNASGKLITAAKATAYNKAFGSATYGGSDSLNTRIDHEHTMLRPLSTSVSGTITIGSGVYTYHVALFKRFLNNVSVSGDNRTMDDGTEFEVSGFVRGQFTSGTIASFTSGQLLFPASSIPSGYRPYSDPPKYQTAPLLIVDAAFGNHASVVQIANTNGNMYYSDVNLGTIANVDFYFSNFQYFGIESEQ